MLHSSQSLPNKGIRDGQGMQHAWGDWKNVKYFWLENLKIRDQYDDIDENWG